MKRKALLLAGFAILGGCASPWIAYQEAVRCHLDDKGPECDAKYQKAIQQDARMRGVHSSYGTHLLLQGKTDQAAEEFKLEERNYPSESSKAIAALTNPAAAAAARTAPAVDTAPPPPDPVATDPRTNGSKTNLVPPPAKSTSAKKGAKRAK